VALYFCSTSTSSWRSAQLRTGITLPLPSKFKYTGKTATYGKEIHDKIRRMLVIRLKTAVIMFDFQINKYNTGN
jgi:hypothetical protein